MANLTGRIAVPDTSGYHIVNVLNGISGKRHRVHAILIGTSGELHRVNAGFPGGTAAGWVGPWARLSTVTPLMPGGSHAFPTGILLGDNVPITIGVQNVRGDAGWVAQALYTTE